MSPIDIILIIIIILLLFASSKEGFAGDGTTPNYDGVWKSQDTEYNISQTGVKVEITSPSGKAHGYISTDGNIVVPFGNGIGEMKGDKIVWKNGDNWAK